MKPIRLFPKLESISDFIIREHPIYHPDSRDYGTYWEEQERYCVEGKWGRDGDKWRYCPGGLYYYINFTIIEHEEEDKSTILIKPILRDIDWYIYYGWLCARGFSGFIDDQEFTCNTLVDKLERKESLSPEERNNLESFRYLKKADGTYKKYIDAREYLYNKCDSPKGLPLYNNAAKNLFLLGSRGLGKSFLVANAVVGHEFTFYGKKYYDDFIKDNVQGPQIFVGASIGSKSGDLLDKFTLTYEYHKSNNGAYGSGDDSEPGIFHRNTTGTLMAGTKKIFSNRYEVKEGGVKKLKGSRTQIHHGIFTTENPDTVAGKRPSVIVVEEVGLVENIIAVHLSNEHAQKRKTKFGSSIYIGTGGNMEKIIGCKIIFENPAEYKMLEYKDLWEDRQTPIGMFIPAYYGSTNFVDEFGNTNIEDAFEQELYERAIRESSKNSSSLDGYKMGRPLVPSEIFLSRSSFVFPVTELRAREAELDLKKVWSKNASIGDLEWADIKKKSVQWREDISKQRESKVINTLNLDNFKGDLSGKVVIYEHPDQNIPTPNKYRSLYKVVYDPIKDDDGGTSLASVLVHKGFTEGYNDGLQNTIVAEWIGRFNSVNDHHLMAIKLALYYNAKIQFEDNIPNFKTFCHMEGYYYLLQATPWDAIKDAIKSPSMKSKIGVTMSEGLIISSEQLARQHLLEPFCRVDDKMLINIDNIYSLRLIRELAAYERDKKTKFDHVSSYFILMLWLSQEKKKVYTQEDVSQKNSFKEQYTQYKIEQLKKSRNELQHWYKY